MGIKLVPAIMSRSIVSDVVESGLLKPRQVMCYYLARGQLRASGGLEAGQDVSGALADFERAEQMAGDAGDLDVVKEAQLGKRALAAMRTLKGVCDEAVAQGHGAGWIADAARASKIMPTSTTPDPGRPAMPWLTATPSETTSASGGYTITPLPRSQALARAAAMMGWPDRNSEDETHDESTSSYDSEDDTYESDDDVYDSEVYWTDDGSLTDDGRVHGGAEIV